MAKKGGKKKGKAGKGKKKGEKREDEMTLKEAMLAFQIQVKEKASEELQFEINGLKEKNKRYQERNERLRDEQFLHIKTLLRQAKEQEHELEQREVYNSEHVEQALKEKWEAARMEEQVVDEMRLKIANIDSEYDQTRMEVEYWSLYRDEGAEEQRTQIRLLTGELEDMQQNFEDMRNHLRKQLDTAKYEVLTYMNHCMAEQKHLASEKAMEQLDPVSVQEVHENEWLKNEAQTHRTQEQRLRDILQNLERENLEIVGELLDCRKEDLKISRNFYLTQFTDDDALVEGNMSDMNLNRMSVYQDSFAGSSVASSSPRAIEDRPMSAMQKAVEDKVFSIRTSLEEEEEDSEEELPGTQDDSLDLRKDMEFLHLGPLEVKLLCVTGEKKPIHSLDAGFQIVDGSKPDVTVTRPVWPIQASMIRSALQVSPSDIHTAPPSSESVRAGAL